MRRKILVLTMEFCFIIMTFISLSVSLNAGSAAPAQAKFKDNRLDKIIKQLDPALRRKAETAALLFGRAFFSPTNKPSLNLLAQSFIRNHFPTFTPKQKELLTAIVIYFTLQYLDQDIKEIKRGLQKVNRFRNKLQTQMQMLQNKYPEHHQE